MNPHSPQHRHRSQSTRISDRCQGADPMGYAHANSSSSMLPGAMPQAAMALPLHIYSSALRIGDPVWVFSQTANAWKQGEVVKFVEQDSIRVEYRVDREWHGKTMHLHSEHLSIPSPSSSFSEQEETEQDPEGWLDKVRPKPAPKPAPKSQYPISDAAVANLVGEGRLPRDWISP